MWLTCFRVIPKCCMVFSLAVESLGMELALAVSLADVSGHRLYLRNTTEQPVLLASLPQYTELRT